MFFVQTEQDLVRVIQAEFKANQDTITFFLHNLYLEIKSYTKNKRHARRKDEKNIGRQEDLSCQVPI